MELGAYFSEGIQERQNGELQFSNGFVVKDTIVMGERERAESKLALDDT